MGRRESNKKWKALHPEASKAVSKRYYSKNRTSFLKKVKAYFNEPRGKYAEYKSAAKRRKLTFDLTLEEFTTFWKQPCYYCQAPIETIGLDRLDNYKGYTISNVVPCDIICNRAKASMTPEEFIVLCTKVANHKRGTYELRR